MTEWVTLAEPAPGPTARTKPGRRTTPTATDAPLRRRPILLGAVAVAVLIVVAVALAGIVAARHLAEAEAVGDASSTTNLLAESVVQPVLSNDLTGRGEAARAARDDLDAVVEKYLATDSIARVKVWTADGRIVYSDESRLVGETFTLAEDDQEALESKVVRADVTDLDEPENRYERGRGKLLEAYRQVALPDGTPLLFEVYFSYDRVLARSGQLWFGFAGITVGSILLLTLLLLPLVAWLLARLRKAEVQRTALLERALDASAAERRRIAGALHDGVVQDLAGTALGLAGTSRRAAATGDTAQSQTLDLAAATVRNSISSLRTLLVDIYPPNLATAGLGAALGDLAATARGRGLAVTIDIPDQPALSEDDQRLVFRVVHECLSNVIAHAEATTVTMRLLQRADDATLEITDDGLGFDAEHILRHPADGHFGLRVLADVAAEAGAGLRLSTSPGAGTRWILRIPLGGRDR